MQWRGTYLPTQGHNSDPCSHKIPRAKRQLSPCAGSPCSPTREATHGKWRVAPTHRNKRKPASSSEHPARPHTHTKSQLEDSGRLPTRNLPGRGGICLEPSAKAPFTPVGFGILSHESCLVMAGGLELYLVFNPSRI